MKEQKVFLEKTAMSVMDIFKEHQNGRTDFSCIVVEPGSDFSNMRFIGCNFSYAEMRKCNFDSCDLRNCCLDYGFFTEGNFKRANLAKVSAISACFHTANLYEANLFKGTFDKSDFGEAYIKDATVYGASFILSNLRRADLTGLDTSIEALKKKYALTEGAIQLFTI